MALCHPAWSWEHAHVHTMRYTVIFHTPPTDPLYKPSNTGTDRATTIVRRKMRYTWYIYGRATILQ